MPRTSPSEIEIVDHGIVAVGTVELDGITVDYLTIKAPVDMSEMLKGLPDDCCACPHFGVLSKGSMTVRYADSDRVDVVKPGDAFHMSPRHVPTYEVGTELVQFSPTEELKATDEAIQRNMARLQGA
jgi:hypothetical protein